MVKKQKKNRFLDRSCQLSFFIRIVRVGHMAYPQLALQVVPVSRRYILPKARNTFSGVIGKL